MSDEKPKKPKKSQKPQKLKARLPRGLIDRGPAEIAATQAMLATIRRVYELYGFEPVETPAIEFTDALGKFLPDQDRPNEGVFSFQDDDEQWLSLRYDLTAPLARYVAENFDALPKPYRSYRVGYVYRNEKPGPGRFRQFMQFDADTVGSGSPAADAEICMMAADAMEALGIPRGQYVVKVNNRKVLDGVMDAAGIPQFKRIETLRCLDKFDKFGEAGVRLLLTSGRKDESGDFTKGVGLTDQQADVLLSIFAPANAYRASYTRSDGSIGYMEGSPDEIIKNWDSILEAHNQIGLAKFFGPPSSNPSLLALLNVNVALKGAALGMEGIAELLFILKLIQDAGFEDRIRIDPSVVRGLEYYTGPVYEVELLLETKDEKGRPVRFGSVGGGGRYDGLVSRFRGEAVPATGFSIGVSRLQAALELINRDKPQAQVHGPVVVTVFDRDRLGDYQKMVATLRNAGIRAELYLGNPKNMGNQLKYADRRNAPCVVIQGSDEKERGEVQIKDLIEGAKAAAAIASNAEWRASRPAQFSCAESDLVEKVRELLRQHGIA